MGYTRFMRSDDMNVQEAINVLHSLIDIYSYELYILDQANNRDWKKQYQLQLKVDRTLMVIDELKKLG